MQALVAIVDLSIHDGMTDEHMRHALQEVAGLTTHFVPAYP